MLEYIADYYLKFKLPSMPVTEAAFIICALAIFGDFSGENNVKRALNYLIDYICLFFPIVILKAVLHTYTDFNLTYVYALVLVPYAFIAGRKRSRINVAVYLFTYWTAYVYATSFAKAIGNLFCTNFGVTETKTVTYIFLAAIVPCVLASCTVMIKKFSLDFYPSLPAYTVIPAVVVDLAANAAKLLVDSVKEEGLPFFGITEAENGAFIFFTGVLLYLLNIFCYAFSYSKAKAIKSDAELKGSLDRIKTESELYKSDAANVKENLEEMRQIRHDIKNQFAYMQIFLSQKDYGGLENVDGKTAFDYADVDEYAKQVVDEYIDNLSIGLINIANIFRPEVIIIGGGVANQGDSLILPLREQVKGGLFARSSGPSVGIIFASLKSAGIVGAAALNM